jgi:cytochrome P450
VVAHPGFEACKAAGFADIVPLERGITMQATEQQSFWSRPIKPRVNLRDPAYLQDPHAFMAAVRESEGLTRDKLGIYLVTRHADVNLGVRSRKLSRHPSHFHLYPQLRPFMADSPLERAIDAWITFSDPPQHARLRGLFNVMFKPRTIDALRPRIEAMVDRLIDEAPGGDTFDLVSAVAQPLPLMLMGDLLGLEPLEVLSSKIWTDVLASVFEPIKSRERQLQVNDAIVEMMEMLRGVLLRYREGRGAEPDSLLGQLVAAMDDGQLTEHELLANMVITFGGGTETTTTLISTAMHLLLTHRHAWELLLKQPELIEPALEECLRYEGPVTFTDRYTVEPTEIGGELIAPGQAVYFMLSAANRDPRVFERADEFDITREKNPHLAFGGGPHYCVGAPMARLEVMIVLERLLKRLPNVELVDTTPTWKPSFNMRAMERLRVRR